MISAQFKETHVLQRAGFFGDRGCEYTQAMLRIRAFVKLLSGEKLSDTKIRILIAEVQVYRE